MRFLGAAGWNFGLGRLRRGLFGIRLCRIWEFRFPGSAWAVFAKVGDGGGQEALSIALPQQQRKF